MVTSENATKSHSIRIGISGKVNSGKDTLTSLLIKNFPLDFWEEKSINLIQRSFSFSTPLKEIAQTMFPIENMENWLYGPSDGRKNIIPNSFKKGQPLTVRQLLLDIGTEWGRGYNNDIWVNNLLTRVQVWEQEENTVSVVSDCRFRNEFDALKHYGFIMIRIKRDGASNINHVSDLEQDEINDSEFDFIINNNGSLDELTQKATEIVKNISNICYNPI